MSSSSTHLLASESSRTTARPYGAHVTSWQVGGDELLFVSREAVYAEGTAIRGGIPVIFPQFAEQGPGPRHGFARKSRWTLLGDGDASVAMFELVDSEATRAVWPHAFRCTLRVALEAERFAATLAVENTGDAPLTFTAALHTYLRVEDVHAVALEGLSGVRYQDKLRGGDYFEQDGALRLEGATDRVYEDAPDVLALTGAGAVRPLRIEKEGFADVVVWNPWREGAEALGDMAADEYRAMLCVEAAQVSAPVTLAPGAAWSGTQRLVA